MAMHRQPATIPDVFSHVRYSYSSVFFSYSKWLNFAILFSKVDFSKLDKVVLFEAATKKVDSNIASASDINFKCSFACPTGMDCSGLSGKAEFYSSADTNVIYTSTSLMWDATKRRTYSYLPQSVWSNYVNSQVRIFLLLLLLIVILFCSK